MLSSAVPDKPEAPVASDIHSDHATLTWTAPASDGGTPVIGYHLERSTNNSGRWLRVSRDLINNLTYAADGLMDDTKYEWRIVAVNARGESQPSEPCDFVAKDPWGETNGVVWHVDDSQAAWLPL